MKKSLISGYLERISSRVFDDYHQQITALVANNRGVYALYKRDHLYYVGLATNLRTRVKHHLRDRHAKKWDVFSLYLIHSAEHLRELESLLIRIAQPRGNVKLGTLKRSQNLIHALKRSMEQRNRRQIDEILVRPRQQGEKTRSTRRKRSLAQLTVRSRPPLSGLLPAGTILRVKYKGHDYSAELDAEGKIHIGIDVFNSPSLAGASITKRPIDGWFFWSYQNASGKWVKIDELRKKL